MKIVNNKVFHWGLEYNGRFTFAVECCENGAFVTLPYDLYHKLTRPFALSRCIKRWIRNKYWKPI